MRSLVVEAVVSATASAPNLEAAGTPIDAYDLLIAGQALHYDATLVTANASEFFRIDGLRWEDWAPEVVGRRPTLFRT